MLNQRTGHLRKICLLLFFAVLTLPLLSIKPMFHPPEFAKSAVFLALFSVLVLIVIYQILFRKNLEEILKIKKALFNKKHAIFFPFWSIIFYLILLFFSTLFSLDIKYSLWGSPLRGGGFAVYSFLIIYSLILFLTLKLKDWQKMWDYFFAVGVAVSFIAIFQKFRVFAIFFVERPDRPVSTLGNPITLSLFLVPLIFLSISFAIIQKNNGKKIFYLFCSFLFLFVILISATRAAFLGLAIGFLFFIFLFPSKTKKIIRIRIILIILAILALFGILWLNSQPKLVEILSKNKAFGSSFARTWSMAKGFSLEKIFVSRASGWQVAFEAIKNRPIFGYGPENFSIAFDRYYDPNLPGLEMSDPFQGRTAWWDKAHSFFFEIGATAGIPALAVYILIFVFLFWQLQKIKNKFREESPLVHGVQASFIGFFIADFFSFDSFSTNLALFLLVAFSLFLIKKGENADVAQETPENKTAKFSYEEPFWKYPLLFFLFIFILIFVWNYSIKPLLANNDLNKAIYWSSNNKCDTGIKKTEDLMDNRRNILDAFARLSYLDILGGDCLAKKSDLEKVKIYYKELDRIKELMRLRPTYTRIWLFDMFYISQIFDGDKNISKEAKEQLGKEALDSFKKALILSPKRQPIFIAGAKINFSLGKYDESKKIIEECVKINPNYPDCWWAKASIHLKLGETKEAVETIKLSIKNGFFDNSDSATKNALAGLINLYGVAIKNAAGKEKIEHYELLSVLYQKIIKTDYKNIQYHASSAHIYKELGRYDKAREEAGIVLELSPESKQLVDDFLKTLPK